MTTPPLAKNELLVLVLHNYSSTVEHVPTLPRLAVVIDLAANSENLGAVMVYFQLLDIVTTVGCPAMFSFGFSRHHHKAPR
jgi:hypothetical protein